jgi:predicted nucleotidyltransferase
MCDRECLNIILENISKRASDIFKEKLVSIYLYGSYARGDYDNDSDVDIMVIVNIDKKELIKYRKNIYKVAHDLGFKFDIIVSVHLQDKETFENWKGVLPYYRNVLKEGMLIQNEYKQRSVTV